LPPGRASLKCSALTILNASVRGHDKVGNCQATILST
jgi:hypothetical protein